jgi:hypothetical protein
MALLLHQFLDAAVASKPAHIALVSDKRNYTYAQIGEMVVNLAAELQQRGVRRGDRVALFLDNSVELVVGVFAALAAGAVFMPINPLTKADKLAYIEGLAHPLDSIVLLSEVLNFDFATRGMDEAFSDADMAALTGLQALRDRVVKMTGKANPTTRDFIEFSRRGTIRELPVLAGTPKDVADGLEEWFVGEGCDGFVLAAGTPVDAEARGAVAAAYRRLGFTLSPRATHSAAMGTANHTIMLENDYFELLSVRCAECTASIRS